ncbi:tetratricopeptide repeat protein [Variovorax rhizosphaerae]|uniref:Tetratricopeptide repeat protein n=1 Tax=Variovorax rhizosphaerae TaxID=1836200 RepID=A0ABU8WEX7_9BURK
MNGMWRLMACGLLAVATGLLGACSTPPARSSADIQAQGYNTQGMDRYKAGDLPRALSYFEQALVVARSIEDEEAIAATRLNLAMVHLGMGRQDEALKQLDAVMDERRLAFSADRRAEAALRRAMAVQASDPAGAEQALDRAGVLCGNKCSVRGKILNLKAWLALNGGSPAEGLRFAQQAQSALAKNDMLERANALRLQSSAYIAMKTPAAAVPLLHEALKIDKAAGASGKIHQDLLLLGQASADKPELARDYWTRARDVAVAAGNAAGSEKEPAWLAGPSP